jgi:hypothetical protein
VVLYGADHLSTIWHVIAAPGRACRMSFRLALTLMLRERENWHRCTVSSETTIVCA